MHPIAPECGAFPSLQTMTSTAPSSASAFKTSQLTRLKSEFSETLSPSPKVVRHGIWPRCFRQCTTSMQHPLHPGLFDAKRRLSKARGVQFASQKARYHPALCAVQSLQRRSETQPSGVDHPRGPGRSRQDMDRGPPHHNPGVLPRPDSRSIWRSARFADIIWDHLGV